MDVAVCLNVPLLEEFVTMSEHASRLSLIPDLTELTALDERISPSTARLGRLVRALELGAALLVVMAASGCCYHFGLRLLAAWQWQ
jgi:hypothetical protein